MTIRAALSALIARQNEIGPGNPCPGQTCEKYGCDCGRFCPYPIIDDHSVEACIAAGHCSCDNRERKT